MNLSLKWHSELKHCGEKLGRVGMSERVIAAVEDFDGSYKGAMKLAGRLKAISQMASSDVYWREQVDDGYHLERRKGADGVAS